MDDRTNYYECPTCGFKCSDGEVYMNHAVNCRLLSTRATTHGSFASNAHISQDLRRYFRDQAGWHLLSEVQRESLDMVATKISRILSGNPNHADHWGDIAGYATLAKPPGDNPP